MRSVRVLIDVLTCVLITLSLSCLDCFGLLCLTSLASRSSLTELRTSLVAQTASPPRGQAPCAWCLPSKTRQRWLLATTIMGELMTLRRCDEGPRQAGREERHRLAQRLGLKLRVRLPPRAILLGLRVVGRLTGVRRMRALLTLCLMRLQMQRRPHRPLYVMERGSSAPPSICAA